MYRKAGFCTFGSLFSTPNVRKGPFSYIWVEGSPRDEWVENPSLVRFSKIIDILLFSQ